MEQLNLHLLIKIIRKNYTLKFLIIRKLKFAYDFLNRIDDDAHLNNLLLKKEKRLLFFFFNKKRKNLA